MRGTTRRARAVVTIVVAAWMSGCAHRLGAGPAAVWELRGAIVSATGEQLAIRHKTGQVVTLILDEQTVVMHNEQRQGRDALRRGRRVRVEVEPLGSGRSRAR